MSLKRQKVEQSQVINDAKKKVNTMENELVLTASHKENTSKDPLAIENEKLKIIIAELTTNIKLYEEKLGEQPKLEKMFAKLRKDEAEARSAAGMYKKELDLAEKELKGLRKNAADMPNNRRHNIEEFHALERRIAELEDQLRKMQVKYNQEHKEKEEAFRMIYLFRTELDQQEDFFKNELLKYGDLARFSKETSHAELDGPLIDQVIQRFNLLQNALKNERFYSEKRSLEEKQMALKVIYLY